MSSLTSRGVFAPGTVKKGTNLYDESTEKFQYDPDGPYEDPNVGDQSTAQNHFNGTREIKLKDPKGFEYPEPTYTHHYPPKELPQEGVGIELVTGGVPFTSRTEYMDEFFNKPRGPRPVEPMKYSANPMPWMVKQTTNQAFYKPFKVEADPNGPADPTLKPATAPPEMPSIYDTTYRAQYVPKDAPGRQPQGLSDMRQPGSWLAGPTTYQAHYVPKELALVPVFMEADGRPVPFDGTTEYRDEFIPKDGYPVMPPLTGLTSRAGLKLPLPRRSLGVEYWHKGKSDNFYILIPRGLDAPCKARQVFTTLHDNQDVACILVLYGDDPVASNNILLGQFDLKNIPPAPKDVPKILVTYYLDEKMYLTAEARDLDTERHKLWEQRGEIIACEPADPGL
eukprot:gene25744-11405_t